MLYNEIPHHWPNIVTEYFCDMTVYFQFKSLYSDIKNKIIAELYCAHKSPKPDSELHETACNDHLRRVFK